MKNYGIFKRIYKKEAQNRENEDVSKEPTAKGSEQKSSVARWAYLTVLAEHKKRNEEGK